MSLPLLLHVVIFILLTIIDTIVDLVRSADPVQRVLIYRPTLFV